MDELIFEVSIGNGIALASKDTVRQTEVRPIELTDSYHANNYVVACLRGNDNLFVQEFINKIQNFFSSITFGYRAFSLFDQFF